MSNLNRPANLAGSRRYQDHHHDDHHHQKHHHHNLKAIMDGALNITTGGSSIIHSLHSHMYMSCISICILIVFGSDSTIPRSQPTPCYPCTLLHPGLLRLPGTLNPKPSTQTLSPNTLNPQAPLKYPASETLNLRAPALHSAPAVSRLGGRGAESNIGAVQ